ncbi:hypothetical protein QTP88_010427 [Uroleucon formosanum]
MSTSQLSEMIVLRDPPQTPSNSNLTTVEYTHWSRNVTLRLIDEYGKNYKDVGSRIRCYKILYEMIAEILNTEFQLKLTGSQTEVIKNTPRACNDTPTLQKSVHEVIDEPDLFINKASGSVEDERKTAVKKTTINLKRKGTRTDVLEGIRSDKQKFYENYIQIQNSKIAEQKRKNDLLEEKNKLLKEYLLNK